MNLLHVISSMDPRSGGPCQGVRNLAPRAREHGNTVEVVCLDDPHTDYLGQESLRVHALGKGLTPWSYHPKLRQWLDDNLSRFDAVILNGLWQYPGYLLSKLAERPNTPPYFVFPHGMLDPWFQRAPERRLKAIRNWFYWKMIEYQVIGNAEAIFFTCAEEMRLARSTFRPYQPKREINVGYGVSQPPEHRKAMDEVFAQKCPGLNLNSEVGFGSTGNLPVPSGHWPDGKVRASALEPEAQESLHASSIPGSGSPPGTGRLPVLPTEFGLKGRPFFLFLGRIHPKKGVDILIKAYAKVYGEKAESRKQKAESSGQSQDFKVSDFCDAPPALVIAGPGLETPYGREMQALAAKVSSQWSVVSGQRADDQLPGATKPGEGGSTLNSQPSILFPGMLTGDAKWGALYNAEVFVLTSHQENFGIAVVESLACGKPVLISNQINIWREIVEDKAGLVGGDTLKGVEQLFRRWENLSPADKAMMKRAAKSSYENRFGIALAAGNLLDTIKDLTMRLHASEQFPKNGADL